MLIRLPDVLARGERQLTGDVFRRHTLTHVNQIAKMDLSPRIVNRDRFKSLHP
jgi:hypothetical protein